MKPIEILLILTIVMIMLIPPFMFVVGTHGRTGKVIPILKAEGVSNIQMTGYKFFGCGEHDIFHDGFIGIRNGMVVNGVVCSGIFKGTTIRYF